MTDAKKTIARSALPWILGVAAALPLGIAGIALAARLHSEPAPLAARAQLYQCPMHPSYTSDKPGACAICGMKLVPVDPADAAPGEVQHFSGGDVVSGLTGVRIDAQRQQLIGLRTAEVTIGTISADWPTVGRVAVDETRVRKINVKVDGFVEKLFVDYVGKPVRRGERLFSLYSPDLLSLQQDYLLAVRTQDQLGSDLVAAARRRLELWDVPETEIVELTRSQLPRRTLTLRSPISGVVTAKSIVQGSRLVAGDTPFEITDLSQVWVLADAHETDLPRVQLGTPVTLSLAALPDRAFKGRVRFIEPVLDARTRTAKVRLSFPNPRGELRPEMFGQVIFHSRPKQALRVPADSIIDSGERKIVFAAIGDGRFEPREIKVGDTAGDLVEVVTGLEAGERVVEHASFLVDSESRLKAAISALTSKAKAEPPSPHAHGRTP